MTLELEPNPMSQGHHCMKGKKKVHSVTGHVGSEGEQIYISSLPLTSALDRVAGQHNAPASPRERKSVPTLHEAG
jgi:serine protease inhibitor ecotin